MIAIGTSAAALFAAFAAWKSANKQAELLAVDIRPILGLSDSAISLGSGSYPILYYFTNYGKGAAWMRRIEVYEGNTPIETHIGTPICIGPGASSYIKVFLSERKKRYSLKIKVYYWDAGGDAHSTSISGDFGWME